MKHQLALQTLLLNDPVRMKALYIIRELKLSDGWIGAGFVRNAVWDHLHGYGQRAITGDVDVVWFNAQNCSLEHDIGLEKTLIQRSSAYNWSVKNQARMHQRNNNAPYSSTENALRYWTETATAVAVRVSDTNNIEIIAPYGLDDLFGLRLRPTPPFEGERLSVVMERISEKKWLEHYPRLQLIVERAD
ncbi:nucleotidyltransferase family protein [Klebsiella sp. BIGb0407]|uniref:nucleotidyltransferase family protein n=1 Tax=Klebsiella sp. BIGb0407 TaxID=2940603 RepID=UPI002169131F|nr:nucleotidyltransferase family protein [Klebsiella sp. BIGb0407]